jgi:hypothetical protein
MSPSMDNVHPEPKDAGSEITLLLSNIESALHDLDRARGSPDTQTALRSLESALHTYGSIKHLLPKLGLHAEQRAVVEKRLAELRARLVTREP